MKRVIWVYGNTLNLAVPLVTKTAVNGSWVTEDYTPPAGSEIHVNLCDSFSKREYTYTLDGNVVRFSDNGSLPLGSYGVEITVKEPAERNLRTFKCMEVEIINCSDELGDVPEDEEIMLDAAIFIQGEKGDPFTYEDFTPEQIADLKKPATDAAAELRVFEGQIERAEQDRVLAEQGRVIAEGVRQENEAERQRQEQSRQQAEGNRQTTFETNEAKRQGDYEEAERGRNSSYQTAEGNRNTAYQTAEGERNTSFNATEQLRQQSENQRVLAEQGRVQAESGRVSAEEGRVEAEQQREEAFAGYEQEMEDMRTSLNNMSTTIGEIEAWITANEVTEEQFNEIFT